MNVDLISRAIPLFLYLNILILSIILIWALPRIDVKAIIAGNWKKIAGLIGIAVVLFCVVSHVPARIHRIFYDEDIYLHISQNISSSGKAVIGNHVSFVRGNYQVYEPEVNKQPHTYPFAVSLLFSLFGVNEKWGFIVNNLSLVAGSFLIALILRLFFSQAWLWVLGAGVYFFIPHNLIWSNTTSSEIITAMLALASVYLACSCAKQFSQIKVFLLALVLPLAVQGRTEGMLLIPVCLLFLFLGRPNLYREKIFWLSVILFVLLLAPQILLLYSVRNNSWGAAGPKFGLSFILPNLKVNGLYYLQNKEFPVALTFFFLIGLFFSSDFGKFKWAFLAWFLFCWGIFIPFYAGSYGYGADERYALLSFAPLCILAAAGIMCLHKKLEPYTPHFPKIALAVLLVQTMILLPFIRSDGEESWDCRKDHEHAQDFAKMLPEESIVLSHVPYLFTLQGKSAAQGGRLLGHPVYQFEQMNEMYPGGVFLHWNYWCNLADSLPQTYCDDILRNYEYTKEKEYVHFGKRFGLYRLWGVRKNDRMDIPDGQEILHP